MNHIAIDLGGIKSQLCARDPVGTLLWEKQIKTKDLPRFFVDLPPSRVVMETCAESFTIADAAIASQHSVGIVAATLVRELGVGYRGVKTDVRDARALSSASCRVENLPFVHIRSHLARERLTRLKMRDALVTSRTQLINCVRGWLRGQLLNVRGTSEAFPKNVRLVLEGTENGLPGYVDQILLSIESINVQIKVASEEIAQLGRMDPTSRLLQTIPGVGPMTSMAFVAVVDQVKRFANATALQSYLGLTPGERSSSQKVRRTSITKAGPAILRQYLTQAALTLWRLRPDTPECQWAERIRIRRGKQVAIIALARKLAGILYAMWRDGSTYASACADMEPAM